MYISYTRYFSCVCVHLHCSALGPQIWQPAGQLSLFLGNLSGIWAPYTVVRTAAGDDHCTRGSYSKLLGTRPAGGPHPGHPVIWPNKLDLCFHLTRSVRTTAS